MLRLVVSLLLAIAAGAAVYLAGAVVWCLIDPEGAGIPLLLTLPLALVAVAIPGLLGILGMINTSMVRQPAARSLTVTEARKPVAPSSNPMIALKPNASTPRKPADVYRTTFTPDHSLV